MPLTLRTNRGEFTIDADQLVGLKPARAQADGQPIEATEVIISIGVMPVPVATAMRHVAGEIEKAATPSRIILASGPVPRG